MMGIKFHLPGFHLVETLFFGRGGGGGGGGGEMQAQDWAEFFKNLHVKIF